MLTVHKAQTATCVGWSYHPSTGPRYGFRIIKSQWDQETKEQKETRKQRQLYGTLLTLGLCVK